MPQPITTSVTTTEDGPVRRAAARPMPTPRQTREQRFRQLVQQQQALSALMVELTLHGAAEDADGVARQVVDIEDELERGFPVRWSRVRSKLLLEESELWAEEHSEDAPCAGCKILSYLSDKPVTVPAPRKVWE